MCKLLRSPPPLHLIQRQRRSSADLTSSKPNATANSTSSVSATPRPPSAFLLCASLPPPLCGAAGLLCHRHQSSELPKPLPLPSLVSCHSGEHRPPPPCPVPPPLHAQAGGEDCKVSQSLPRRRQARHHADPRAGDSGLPWLLGEPAGHSHGPISGP
jgi:hypothetical protein